MSSSPNSKPHRLDTWLLWSQRWSTRKAICHAIPTQNEEVFTKKKTPQITLSYYSAYGWRKIKDLISTLFYSIYSQITASRRTNLYSVMLCWSWSESATVVLFLLLFGSRSRLRCLLFRLCDLLRLLFCWFGHCLWHRHWRTQWHHQWRRRRGGRNVGWFGHWRR